MIKCSVLGSGSKGNAVYVEVDGVAILLDAGLTYKQTASKLDSIGKNISDISFVFVSHSDHGDHYAACEMIRQKNNTTIIGAGSHLGNISHGDVVKVGNNQKVIAFDLDHDVPCVGFRVEDGDGNAVVYVTDTGTIPCDSLGYMLDAGILIIEANHDPEMLVYGPYPDDLKLRVLETHLDNVQAKDLVEAVSWDGLKFVVCHHLSEKNNSIEYARYEVTSGTVNRAGECCVMVAKQNEVTRMMVLM